MAYSGHEYSRTEVSVAIDDFCSKVRLNHDWYNWQDTTSKNKLGFA